MNKWYFLVLLLLLAATQAQSATVFERSFEEMGYADVVTNGPNTSQCSEIMFLFPGDVNYQIGENYIIASLNLLLSPVKGKNFYALVKLNDENAGHFFTETFSCGAVCWQRVFLPKDLIKAGENSMEVCLNNSADVTKSVLGKESMIGVYRTVDFLRENAFVEKAEKEELLIGEKTKITMLLHNYGSAAGFVEMRHARQLAEDKEAYVVVDGNTEFKGFINSGETIELTYTIKPRVLGDISLPPAILYYSNEFGEPQQRFAKMTTIHIKEPEKKIKAFVVKDNEINKAGEIVGLQLAVKNKGKDPLFNLAIRLTLPDGLSIVKEPVGMIDVIQPGEVKYLDFSARATQEGEFSLGCKITYTDLNASESNCEQSTLVFKKEEIPAEIFIGIVLVTIAVAVYLYIQKSD